MPSESARMSSAAEARFRIDAPNSKRRAIKIIALDAPAERLVKRLAQAKWNQASFFTASAFAGAPAKGESFSMTGWLSDVAGRTKNLIDEVASADLVVMVATAAAATPAKRYLAKRMFVSPLRIWVASIGEPLPLQKSGCRQILTTADW